MSKKTWTSPASPMAREGGGTRSLTHDQLGVVFQPIVDIANGKLFAFEALVRCKNPAYPSPPALFDAAEKENACGYLGRLIRENAFATCGDVALFRPVWSVSTQYPMTTHFTPSDPV